MTSGIWNESRYVQVLSDLVSIPSISGNESDIADYVESFLEKEGTAFERDGEDNIVARKGEGRPAVHLLGHLDTVPPVSGWESDPYKPVLKAGKLYGLGTSDMKAGVAVMLNLITTMTPPGQGSIHCDFTVCEESSAGGKGNGARRIAETMPADVVITLEPTAAEEGRPEIEVGCQGSFGADVKVRGSACHSSAPWKGKNAIYEAARLVLEIEKMNDYEWVDFYKGARYRHAISVTLAEGGTANNVIPDSAVVHVNRRVGPDESGEDFRKELEGLCVGRDVEIVRISGVEGAVTDLDGRLLRVAEEAYRELYNSEPVYRFALGRTDAAQFRDKGTDVVTIGPGSVGTIHRENEWVCVERMPEAARLLDATIRKYLAGAGG
ncbi:MAG: M20/M25/M40 family metallo-hydrolase [Planctomycetes bacterium]|nr:M20/M25/M40 family metallo-hydrolase [Planctomycetota bacterium]